MDTTSRGWNITRAAREGGKTTRSHSICQTTTENDVTAMKDQNFRRDENFTSRGKDSTRLEDDATSSVGSPARKGRTTGLRDRRRKIECRAHHSVRRRFSTKTSHHATRGIYGQKENLGLGTVLENH